MREQYVLHGKGIWECQQHRLKAVKMYLACSIRRRTRKNTVLFGKRFGKHLMRGSRCRDGIKLHLWIEAEKILSRYCSPVGLQDLTS